MQSFGLEKLLLFTCKRLHSAEKGLPGLRSRALGLNDLARHETYLCSHLREISKRCRISSVLINGIIAKRRTSIDASAAELKKVASYAEKNDANIFQA